MEVAPRTRIFGAVPKVPLTFCTLTPAALPSREREMSATPSSFALCASMVSAAPVNKRRSTFCIPVTTTSPRVLASSCKIIFRLFCPALWR